MVTFHSSTPGRSHLVRGWPEQRPHPPAYLLRKLVVSVVLDTSTSMAESDNWVFDSLVGFLRGPVWNVPILTFIEHKSLVFEPEEDEQNEKEYKKIHDDYKNLVDFMLGSYMEDIGITPAQFEEACGKGTGKVKKQFHHGLFEQVWAADDFEIFKRMMLQKNIELQLQALELLQQRYGVLPESLQPEGNKTEDENESKVMEEVARISKEDHEAHVAALNQEEAELEEVLAHSLDEHKRLTAAKQNQEHLLAEHFLKVNIADPSGEAFESDSFPAPFEDQDEITIEDEPVLESEKIKNNIRSLKELEINDENIQENYIENFPKHDAETIDHVVQVNTASQEVAEILENSLIDSDDKTLLISSPAKCTCRKPKGFVASDIASPVTFTSSEEVDPADLARRTAFLKLQRDKLLEMKRAEREKQLVIAESSQGKSRPKSARAARTALGTGGRMQIDPKTLEIRRALAEKLKKEVIGEGDD